MEMIIRFPGGKKVDAEFIGQVIHTDQSPAAGGEGSAPEPFSHFLASIGTCAGIYVLGFCQARGISTEGLKLTQEMEFDSATHRLAKVKLTIHLPPGFPERYVQSVMRAADLCAVKKSILNPPEFEIKTQQEGSSALLRARLQETS
jgi:putative redox protein